MEGDCNHCWNEQVFSQLGLDLVWKVDGVWIPGYERPFQQLDWYSYCDTFGIPWQYPRLLPEWAIQNMDDYHEYECHRDMGDDIEENDSKYISLSCLLTLLVASSSTPYT